MPDQKLRIGIAGCGMATLVMYSPVVRLVERAEVTALCDPFQGALDQAKTYFPSAETYLHFDEFLTRARVDAVIMATPTHMHHDHVLKAARAGKHLMCEKPMARTLDECDEMIEACRAAGVTLMIGFMKRFDKSLAHAKHLLEEGRLGSPLNVHVQWRGQQPAGGSASPNSSIRERAFSWRTKLDTWGGRFQDIGSHTTDLARWWLGDIKTVSGEIAILGPGREVEDSAVAVYVHEGGQTSLHELSYSHKLATELYEINGSKATLDVEYGPSSFSSTDPFRMRIYENGGGCIREETLFNQIVLDDELRASGRYKVELDHFCDCVLDGKQPLTSGLDGRKAIEAINAVYLSAYLGEKIHLPLEKTPDLPRLFAEMKARSPHFA